MLGMKDKAAKQKARSDLTRSENVLKTIVKAGEALDIAMAAEGHIEELNKTRDDQAHPRLQELTHLHSRCAISCRIYSNGISFSG